jgi:hypothetical protein
MSELTPEPKASPAPPPRSRLAPLLALVVVAVATVVVVLIVVLAGPGAAVARSGQVTVHYAPDVPRGKALRLARYLEVEEIGGGKEVEARLSRDADGEGWVVDLFVTKTPQLAKDPQFHGLVTLLHDIIRSRILQADRLHLRVCDRLDLEERLSGRKEPVPWKEVGP